MFNLIVIDAFAFSPSLLPPPLPLPPNFTDVLVLANPLPFTSLQNMSIWSGEKKHGVENERPKMFANLFKNFQILRHEKVQENCIDLVGRIADRGAEYVSAREWMRICFELLELLKAHKKSIRRAAVNTFGYIAKAIGPHDVLATLLNNLKVQERQLRICTTVAIAIVAETCSPFTVLPALMNEYRIPG